jgi:DNA-directed RNA polymerase specialized sigma24 family protein
MREHDHDHETGKHRSAAHPRIDRPVGDDPDLLEQFTAERGRRGVRRVCAGTVRWFGVCRRVLHNADDADDAFQATFLVLGARPDRSAANVWGVGVSGRPQHRPKARASAAARQRREQRAGHSETSADPLTEVTGRELLAVLDQELSTLSRRCREPLVLCYLQGLTRDEAARQLGCSESTLKRRLELGKGHLRNRLARRGLSLPAALLTVGVAGSALPASLAAATARTVAGFSTTVAPGRGAGAAAATATRLKAAAALLLAVARRYRNGSPCSPGPRRRRRRRRKPR